MQLFVVVCFFFLLSSGPMGSGYIDDSPVEGAVVCCFLWISRIDFRPPEAKNISVPLALREIHMHHK